MLLTLRKVHARRFWPNLQACASCAGLLRDFWFEQVDIDRAGVKMCGHAAEVSTLLRKVQRSALYAHFCHEAQQTEEACYVDALIFWVAGILIQRWMLARPLLLSCMHAGCLQTQI